MPALKLLPLCRVVLLGLIFVASCSADTFQVNTTDDTDDSHPLDLSKPLSLRKAIRLANEAGGGSRIEFAIPSTGVATIRPLAALPPITAQVVIDGYTQPNAQANSDPLGDNAVLMVEIDGSLTSYDTNCDGLLLANVANCEIRGLILNEFEGTMINLNMYANNNVIAGNWIGLKSDGRTAGGSLNNDGVYVASGWANRIGGVTPADRNVISGNGDPTQLSDVGHAGVRLWGYHATNNLVVGNFIGTDIQGAMAVPNSSGISVQASGNFIGDGSKAGRNVISGNLNSGIYIWSYYVTNRVSTNVVRGNYIGVSADSSHAVPNGTGVVIADADLNTIGGPLPGDTNVISGNTNYGVSIQTWYILPSGLYVAGQSASRNVVEGNIIGADRTGLLAMGNGAGGVSIASQDNSPAISNRIGGVEAGVRAGNVISGNIGNGIQLSGTGTKKNLIQANLIGLDITGEQGLTNSGSGVWIGALNAQAGSAVTNTIGGIDSSGWAGNVISGNQQNGVVILFEPTATAPSGGGHLISGNLIGTDVKGLIAVTNNGNGVLLLDAASGCQIGGASAASRNVISGNLYAGVALMGSLNQSNLIVGNYIGTDLNAANAIPNSQEGVLLGAPGNPNGALQNTVGGDVSALRNVISGNRVGLLIANGSTNYILGNYVGADATGLNPLPNIYGIWITAKTPGLLAQGNRIGDSETGAGNLIVFNQGYGVLIEGTNAIGNVLQGNFIGTDSTGSKLLPNVNTAVRIDSAVGSVIGAPPVVNAAPGQANWILANPAYTGVYAVQVVGDLAVGNCVRGNLMNGGNGPAILLGAGPSQSPNNPGGVGTGPNEAMNRPTLLTTNYFASQKQTTISGWLDARNPPGITIDLYMVAGNPPAGSWAGMKYLGAAQPDNLGWFCFLTPTLLLPGDRVYATATSPLGSTSSTSLDSTFRIRAIEVNQSVQDWNNSVPLVEGKPTYARVFLETVDGSTVEVSMNDLHGRLHAVANGRELSGSPLDTTARVAPLIAFPDASKQERDMTNSVNFWVPPAWLHNQVTLWFEGDGVTCGTGAGAAACQEYAYTVSILPSPRLQLRVLDVSYYLADANPANPPTLAGNAPSDLGTVINIITAEYPLAKLDLTIDPMRLGTLTKPLAAPPSASEVNRAIFNSLPLSSYVVGRQRRNLGLIPGTPAGANIGQWMAGAVVGSGYYTLPKGKFRSTPAHELGHGMGRPHSYASFTPRLCEDAQGNPIPGSSCFQGQCNEWDDWSSSNPNFPYEIGGKPSMGPSANGVDAVFALDASSPASVHVMSPTVVFDLMSYCRSDDWGTWPSKFTYTNLMQSAASTFGYLPSPQERARPRVGGDWLLVRGSANLRAGAVQFTPFSRFLGTADVPILGEGDYELRLLGADGSTLYVTSFGPVGFEGETAASLSGGFVIPINYNAAYYKAEVLRGGVVIASRTASPHSPVLTSLSPDGGEFISGSSVTISWSAGDADSDPLTYDVQLSLDGGATWNVLATDWPETQLVIDRSRTAGSSNALVRVVASDGFNTDARASAGFFTLSDALPELRILSPSTNQSIFAPGQMVLSAYARDPEDGWLDGTNVVWWVDGQGLVDSGATLTFPAGTLAPGWHTIQAAAFDYLGQSVTGSVPFIVYTSPPPKYADLSLAMSVSPDVPSPYSNFTVSLTVDNAGPDWAQTARVTNDLPAGLTLLGVAVDGGTWVIREGKVITTLDEVAPGSNATVVLTLQATNTAYYSVFGTVVGADPDPDLANNSARLNLAIQPVLPDLRLTLTTSPQSPAPGEPLSCVVTVFNAGQAPATAASITNTLPPGVPVLNVSLSQGSWRTNQDQLIADLGSLQAGGTAVLTVVLGPPQAGPVWYQVSGGEAEPDAEPLDNLMTSIVQVGLPLRLRFSAQGSLVSLQWDDSPNVVLQQTSQLGAAASWGPAAGTPVLNQGTWSLTIPAGGQSRFYRLKEQ